MQDALLRVFVVALGLLLCPRDDPGVEEEEWIHLIKKHEERLLKEEVILDQETSPSDPSRLQKSRREPEIAPKTSKNLMDITFQDSIDLKKPEVEKSSSVADWEEDYVWYAWNALSVITLIRFFAKYLKRIPPRELRDARTFPATCVASETPLPDSDTLQRFHAKCVQENKRREKEFLEGFVNDLVDAMRIICDGNGGMVIAGYRMIGPRDIIVPFTPPEPYGYRCVLWDDRASDLLPDLQVCGQIKLVENRIVQNGCQCQSSHRDEDMVCLLRCKNEKAQTKTTEVRGGRLCSKNTPFLSKSQVTRWFQSTVKESWAQISHKYDFELGIRYVDAPGALLVRFRSGKKISFTMNPAVKFNTHSHFYVTPYSQNNSDTSWTLSLTAYEDQLLESLSKRLPPNPCHMQTLEIACFLHKRQTALSGSGALESFHFKTALMHLLLTRDPSLWKPDHVARGVRDLLVFMEGSLEKKLLQHVLIGNPLARKIIHLPDEFTQAKPVNLFHPLVVDGCTYRNAVKHFQEMVRNAHMLIQEYVSVHYPCKEKVSTP